MNVYEWQKDFEARLSQVRSDVALSIDESQITPLDPTEEHRLRTRCWVAIARPKHKRCLYSTGDLAHSYKLEMIASCSICKDLTVALKIQQRLID